MFEVEIDGTKVKAEVSFYTAQLYESEFRSDIIQDLFGTQNLLDGELEFDGDTLVSIDFSKIDWLAVTKALWAAIKTNNPDAPSYMTWMRTTSGANLWDVRDTVISEVSDCFFRSPTAEEGTEGEGREGEQEHEAVHEDGAERPPSGSDAR